MATLPGLPMFGHGQIEGFTERYGMEFKQAMMDEWPNEDLVARHQREIAPLLKNRYLFAESGTSCSTTSGTTTDGRRKRLCLLESPWQRALDSLQQQLHTTRGTIHISAASMDKGSGNLRQRSLAEGLALPLRRRHSPPTATRPRPGISAPLHRPPRHGLTFDLRGYQYAVLLDWRELRASADSPGNAPRCPQRRRRVQP